MSGSNVMDSNNDRVIDRGKTESGRPVYEVSFTFDESPAAVVVETIARIEGRSMDEGPPIYGAVDADALEQLVEHARTRPAGASLSVEFAYYGYRIRVTDGGSIRLEKLDD